MYDRGVGYSNIFFYTSSEKSLILTTAEVVRLIC